MPALITFVREELDRQNISQLELSGRSGIPNSTLSRMLNDEVGEWKPSAILAISKGLGVPFWKLMTIAGYPADRPDTPEGQDRRLAVAAGYDAAP